MDASELQRARSGAAVSSSGQAHGDLPPSKLQRHGSATHASSLEQVFANPGPDDPSHSSADVLQGHACVVAGAYWSMAAEIGLDDAVSMSNWYHAKTADPPQVHVQLPGGAMCQILAEADSQTVVAVQQRRMVPALRLQMKDAQGEQRDVLQGLLTLEDAEVNLPPDPSGAPCRLSR